MTIEAQLERTNELLERVLEALTAQQNDSAEKATTKTEVLEPRAQHCVEVKAEHSDAVLNYDTVAKAVLNVVTHKSKKTALETLKLFGINKLPEAKPEQYAAILKACEEALGA